jgi:hypothetical protein
MTILNSYMQQRMQIASGAAGLTELNKATDTRMKRKKQ